MYKAIPGVLGAYQSINAQIPIVEKKRPSWRLDHAFEDAEDPVVREKNLRHQEVNQYYSDIENCAARIAAKLREIDNIDLNQNKDDSLIEESNQKRFIDDQIKRAQAALPTEFYMRKLNSTLVHREIIDIDERITHNAKNYRTSLIDIGVKEVDLQDEVKPTEKGSKKSKSQPAKKKQPIGVPKKETATVIDENELTMDELDKMNDEVLDKMHDAFAFNEKNITGELTSKTAKFREHCLKNTNQLFERRKREIKDAVVEKEKQLRALEAQLPVIRAQNEEADALIAKKKDSDYEVRQIVEEHYRETMTQLTDHSSHQYDEIQTKNEALRDVSHKLTKCRLMKEELEAKRSRADPFMRRRAQNLVKGLLQNLNEKDQQIQEEREEKLSENYKQWKEVKEMIALSERKHRTIETQCNSTIAEIMDQKCRIEMEKVSYKEKAKQVKQLDEDTGGLLKFLEKIIISKAREEKRAEQLQMKAKHLSISGSGSHDANDDLGVSVDVEDDFSATGEIKGDSMTAAQMYIKSMEKKYKEEIRQATGAPTKAEAAQRRMSKSIKRLMSIDLKEAPNISAKSDDLESRGEHSSGESDSENDDSTVLSGISTSKKGRRQSNLTAPTAASSRREQKRTSVMSIKVQQTLRPKRNSANKIQPLCDTQTEAILDITAVQTKRQDMTKTKLALTSSPLYHTAPSLGKSFNASGMHNNNLSEGIAAAVLTANSSPTQFDSDRSKNNSPEVKWRDVEDSHSRPTTAGNLIQNESQQGTKRTLPALFQAGSNDKVAERSIRLSSGMSQSHHTRGHDEHHAVQLAQTPVHSVVCAACYVDCYQREAPVMIAPGTRASNRLTISHLASFEIPGMEPQAHAMQPSFRRSSNVMKQFSGSHYTTNLIKKYCSQQSPVSEGVKVLANILFVLHSSDCLSKDRYASILKDLENISSAEKLCSTSAEEDEVRYKLHVCCVSVIQETMSCSPKTLLIQNNRSQFVEILTHVLGVIGIIMNCSLFYWKPTASRNGVSAEKIEMVASQIVEVVIANGTVDKSIIKKKLPQLTHSENSVVKEQKHPDPLKFIDSLRALLDVLLNSVGAENKIITHPLLTTINSKIDSLLTGGNKRRESVSANEYKECAFTIAHRHAIYGIQLCLYCTLNDKEFSSHEVNEMFEKAITDGDKLGQVKDTILECIPVIPTNFDDLLLQVNPQIVPALYALELLRTIIEEELSRVKFVEKISQVDKNVSELQFLNAGQNVPTDLAIQKSANVPKDGRSLSVTIPSTAGTVETADNDQPDETLSSTKVPFHATSPPPATAANTEVSLADVRHVSPHKPSVSHHRLSIASHREDHSPNKKLSVSHVKLSLAPTAPTERKKSRAIDRPNARKLSNLGAEAVDSQPVVVDVVDNFTEFSSVIRPFVPVVQPATRFSTFAAKNGEYVSSVPESSSLMRPPRESVAATSPPHASPLPSQQTSIKQVHADWLKDVESHVLNLSRQIHALVWNPALTPLVMSMSPTKTQHSFIPVGEDENAKSSVIPLPDGAVYKILHFVEALQKVLSGHYSDGLQRVEALKPTFLDCVEEIRISRGKILRIVSALSWPMKKRLDWLKTKLNVAIGETSSTTKQIDEKSEAIVDLKKEIEKYRLSLTAVEREKSLGLYKKTRHITLMNHSPDIQKLILEHATRENYAALQDCKAKEVLLGESLVQFEKDFESLKAMHDRLKLAHQSMGGGVTETQSHYESTLQSIHQSMDDSTLDLEEGTTELTITSLHPTGRIASPIIPPKSPLDAYLQNQRLSEMLSDMNTDYEESGLRVADTQALNETLKSISLRAKSAAAEARAKDAHEQLQYMIRLSAESQAPPVQKRVYADKPNTTVVHPKVFGFANRIESGLLPLNSNQLSSSPTPAEESVSESDGNEGLSDIEMETLAEKMLSGEYADVVDSTNRPSTTGGVTRKMKRAARVAAIASGMMKTKKERLGEMIPVPAKTKDENPDRSFLFYMGKSDFHLNESNENDATPIENGTTPEKKFADLTIQGANVAINEGKPNKIHAPHLEAHSPHKENYFLRDLKRVRPFKQSQLYPPASSSAHPLDLGKLMNIERKAKDDGSGDKLSNKRLSFDDELPDDFVENHEPFGGNRHSHDHIRAQQPSPMQVVVNIRPKSQPLDSDSHLGDGSYPFAQGPMEGVDVGVHDTAASSMNSLAEESESMDDKLLELQQVEQLANEETLSSIAHIQQVHGPSQATSAALGAASMAVAAGSIMLARKKSTTGTLRFDPYKFSKKASSKKFVLGDSQASKSRAQSKAQLIDTIAHDQKLFNWEEIDLFKVDEEESFMLHNFNFEDDSETNVIKSHTFVNAADGQQREITASQVEEARRSSVVHSTMLNNQIKELLQSEVVVVLEEIPLVEKDNTKEDAIQPVEVTSNIVANPPNTSRSIGGNTFQSHRKLSFVPSV